jgi:hypothetical protein
MTDLISPMYLESVTLELLEKEWDELTVDEQSGKLNKLISPFFKTCE